MVPRTPFGRTTRAVALGGALLAAVAATTAASAPAGAAARPSPGGVWRMDGYGTVLSVDAGAVREYQVSAAGCLRGYTAGRTGAGGAGSPGNAGPWRYADDDGDVLTLRRAARPGRATMRIDGSPGTRGLRRIAALPDACRRTLPGDPVTTFDVFWQTFRENYPFFAAKGIDWTAVRDRYRPKVHAGMSDKALFAILSDMVAPLYDAHVRLDAGDTGVFARVRPGTSAPDPGTDADLKRYIQERDLAGGRFQEFARGRISYADLPDGQGYLRLSGFSGFTQDGTYAADSAELDRALDTVLSPGRTARLHGLIVDLRHNGGGSDALGLRLASRLTDRAYFAYAKRVRDDPDDPARFTRPQPLRVHPAPTPRYPGPVAVLTGGSTFSAAETFTQALIERPGRTVRIGEPTQGVFSDGLDRKLPNGWRLILPNEEFLTRSGRTFDGPGIPPHLTEPVFTREEFAHHRDSAFDRAREVLRAGR